MPESGNRWVGALSPSASAFGRLICFPHAGGSASYLSRFLAALAQYRGFGGSVSGRQDRRNEKNIEGIGKLADRAFEAVVPWCQSPVALFGSSIEAVGLRGRPGDFERNSDSAPRLDCLWPTRACNAPDGKRAPARQRRRCRRDAPLDGTNAVLLDDQESAEMVLPATLSDYKAIKRIAISLGQGSLPHSGPIRESDR